MVDFLDLKDLTPLFEYEPLYFGGWICGNPCITRYAYTSSDGDTYVTSSCDLFARLFPECKYLAKRMPRRDKLSYGPQQDF